MSASMDPVEHVRAAVVALAAAERLHLDRDYVRLNGFVEINVLLTEAKVHLGLAAALPSPYPFASVP